MKNGLAWITTLAILLSISAVTIYNEYSLKKADKVQFHVETKLIPAKNDLNTYRLNPIITIEEFLEEMDNNHSINLKNSQ